MSLLNSWRLMLFRVIFLMTTATQAHAQFALSGGISATGQLAYSGLQGSGYYGGVQACPYNLRPAKNAYDDLDEVVEEEKAIVKLRGELSLQRSSKNRTENLLKEYTKKLEKYFDPEISDFIISVHIDNRKKCDEYREQKDCSKVEKTDETGKVTLEAADAATKTACEGKAAVPDLLKNKWLHADAAGKGPYCIGSSTSNAGTVSTSICTDTSLRPNDGTKSRSLSISECQKALANYRKTKIEFEKAQTKYEEADEEIKERRLKIADAKTRAKIEDEYKQRDDVEGGCEECALAGRGATYRKPQRDWLSTSVNVLGGLGLAWYGKKVDEASMEYNAQLGRPSYNSYGYPFVQAGIGGVVNGLVGPGAYGCSGGYGGAGYPYGAGGAYGAFGATGYGPNAALGGAFGYPQSLFGSPWGGGMYQPGFNLNGQLAGPGAGWPNGFNGQFGLGVPVNGGLGTFANGGIGAFLNGGIGAFTNAGGYLNGGGFLNGGAFANNPQYQMQMMQQQQALQQQQAMQQQQYYQAQLQAQMQAYQRQQIVQQQAVALQQEMSALQSRLQMLYSGAYSGSSYGGLYGSGLYGGGSLGTGVNFGIGGIISGGVSFGAGAGAGVGTGLYNYNGYNTYNGYGNSTLINSGTTTLPGSTTGTVIRGR